MTYLTKANVQVQARQEKKDQPGFFFFSLFVFCFFFTDLIINFVPVLLNLTCGG